MTMTATTIGADASLFVIEVSPTAALLRATNGGAQHVVWVRWDDFELAASPANDPDLRRLYFRALEAARLLAVSCRSRSALDTPRLHSLRWWRAQRWAHGKPAW